MDINLSMSPAPSIPTNHLVVAVYESSAPGSVVQSQDFPAPHTGQQNITFSNLNPVVHIVKVFESPTSSPSGTVRHQFIYDPSFQNAIVRDDAYLTVGSSSGLNAGTSVYLDASLLKWKLDLERRGFGTMTPGVDYSFDSATGTITLLGSGDAFQAGEVFIIRFQPQITTVTANVSVQQLFTTVEVRTADTILTASSVQKMQTIQGAGDHLTITLPKLSDIPDYKVIPFSSEGGSHINVTIQTQGLDQIKYLKQNLSSIVMAQSEEIWFYKSGGAYCVCFSQGNFKTVGEIVQSYLINEENTLFCDGSLVSRLTYPRLWNFAQSLDASALVSDTNWNNPALNLKGCFSMGDGSTTFRVPLLHTPGYLRGIDGITRKAGTWQDQGLQAHHHAINSGAGDPKNINLNDDGHFTGNDPGSGGTHVGDTADFGGTETTPRNIGIYLLMRY